MTLSFVLKAQTDDDYYNENRIRYDDYVYSENIKSVEFHKTGRKYSLPMIALGSGEKLKLSFDDIESGSETYYYTFILCNSDWSPSSLMPMEYMDGLKEEFFNNTYQSFNTTIHYTHYETILPSDEIKLTKAGNYILKVYPEGYPDNPIITRRMYVYESRLRVEAVVSLAKEPQDRYHKQELSVKIHTNQYPMPDIYSNLTVKVQQNGRKDNIKTLEKPMVVTAEYVWFNTIGDIVFNGTNEFRKLDIRSFKVQSARVARIDYDSSGYQIYMLPDEFRAHKKYINYQDINGEFAVINWDDPQVSEKIESDYAFVHFSLPVDNEFTDGDFYLCGAFTNWRLDRFSRLQYNPDERAYQTTLILKQGYYDYNYVYLPHNSTEGDMTVVEGNHSDTENDYYIFVYYRDQGELYDHLISIEKFSSVKTQ